MSRQCEYYGCKSEATTTNTTSIATEMYPEATMTSHLCAAHAAESASVTVTVTVPEWIVRQIVAGEFTAVNAAAQIIETAILSTLPVSIDDIDLGTVDDMSADSRHDRCESALAALNDAEDRLASVEHHIVPIRRTAASGYFPQPHSPDYRDLDAARQDVAAAAADYMDCLAAHAEDSCCAIEGY